jgi:hypothetical protein
MYERVEVRSPGNIKMRESSKYGGKGEDVNVLVKDGEEGV